MIEQSNSKKGSDTTNQLNKKDSSPLDIEGFIDHILEDHINLHYLGKADKKALPEKDLEEE